jgi:GH24 family phage-related lysozyme (muramidase)
MNLSHKGYTKLRSKGFRAKPYRDEDGNLYVGYRHKLCPDDGVAHKDVINSFKASELLMRDVEQAVAKVLPMVTSNITQEEFDALVIGTLN